MNSAQRKTAHAICRDRLAAQLLTARGPARASAVVSALGAVQAQDYAGAKWALGMRAREATDAAIERELAGGRILRTHVLRPTWHFVAPQDIRWMLSLTAPRVARIMASYNRVLELTPAVFRKSNRVIERALRDGNHLTRIELRASLERSGINAQGTQRLARIMMQAELDALVCSGPRRGNQFTYALLDERAPPTPARDRDECLGDLVLRYFRTRGPATAADFAWWSGLTMADARRGIGIAGSELERVDLDGRPHWRASGAPPSASSASALLLPNYDEYFIGFRDRGAIGVRLGDARLVTGGSALTAHVIVLDGQLVGGWKRQNDGGEVVISARLLTRISRAERRRLDDAVAALETHLGTPVRLDATPA